MSKGDQAKQCRVVRERSLRQQAAGRKRPVEAHAQHAGVAAEEPPESQRGEQTASATRCRL